MITKEEGMFAQAQQPTKQATAETAKTTAVKTATPATTPATTPAKVVEKPAPAKSQGAEQMNKLANSSMPQVLIDAGLANCFTKPRQAFISAGGTEQQFSREVNFAIQAMMANPYLIQCAKTNPNDLIESIKNIGLTGLTLNPTLRLGYLVPFKGKISFMPSYMGKKEILMRTGLVRSIEANLVYEGEEFIFTKGVGGTLKHTPDPFKPKKDRILKGGYFYAVLSDGTIMYDVMPKDRIDEIMARSEGVKAGKTTPWVSDETEMQRKTVLNWAFKFIPKTGISEDKLKVIESMNEYDDNVVKDYYDNLKNTTAKKDKFSSDKQFSDYEEV